MFFFQKLTRLNSRWWVGHSDVVEADAVDQVSEVSRDGIVLAGHLVVDTQAAAGWVIFESVAGCVVADHCSARGPFHEAALVGEDGIGALSVSDDDALEGVGLGREEGQNGIEFKSGME